MRENISEQIKKLLEEPLQTPTKQEAYDRLMACGIITNNGEIATAYKDVIQIAGVHAFWRTEIIDGKRYPFCSHCDRLGNYSYSYCPICGAKMDAHDELYRKLADSLQKENKNV